MDRRRFLRGAGGAVLALPVLPSLFTSGTAAAQAVQNSKCFVHMRTPHGGIATANMWAPDSALTQTMTYTHPIRRGDFTAPVDGAGNAVFSPVLSAPAAVLPPSLQAKMNALRGLDVPTYLAHNFGAALGYYDVDKQRPKDPRATIDQLMAYSPAFYPSISSVRRRSVGIGRSSGSHGYVTPGVRSSGVSNSGGGVTESAQGLFDTLLGGITNPGTGTPARAPIVDKILDSYKRLRNGNKRLSQDDRHRLDQHIDSVAELQRRLNTTIAGNCVVPTRPSVDSLSLRPMDGVPEKNAQFFSLINDVLAVALNCGVTRVVTLDIDENNQALTFTSRAAQGEDWHNNVSHSGSSSATAQALVVQFHQTFFARVYLDLVNKLNAFSDGMGGSLLDRSLVVWGQESGNVTHFSNSMPVITAGSGGGAIKTGSYCDYRDLSRRLSGDSSTGNQSNQLWAGLIYNQWLTTALLAMGVPRSEWAETSHPGYGERVTWQSQYAFYFTNLGYTAEQVYTEAKWQKTGEMLPFLA